jgi:hypothetical protein
MVATAALVGPSMAFADDCSGPTSIYSEGCSVPTVTGHHSTQKPAASQPTTPTWTTTTPYVPTPPPVKVTPNKKPHHRQTHVKITKLQLRFIKNPGLGYTDHLNLERMSLTVPATSLGSAMDLGTGPTILFVMLLGAVLATLGAGGFRAWRNRHRA